MLKKRLSYILAVGVFMLFLTGCTIDESDGGIDNGPGENQTQNQTENEGQLVFAITDVAAELDNISNVFITIDEIEVMNQTDEWRSIDVDSQRFDLIELRNQTEIALLANQSISSGMYERMRLVVSDIVVVENQSDFQARIPSNELRINTDVEIDENATSLVIFDFILDESLHITGNGEYIFAPVIQVESRKNAEIMLQQRNRIRIENRGEEISQARIGMDENGNVGVGRRIDRNANITIDNGRIQIGNQSMNQSQRGR